MNAVKIETAKCSDAENIVQIHHAAVHQTAAGFYSETILDNWSGPLTQDRVDRISAAISHPEKLVLVARDNTAIAGFGIVDLDKNYLGAIYVAPFMGRKQVGTALLVRLEALSRARGLTWLQLDASLNAEAFYRKHGYQVVEKSFHTLGSGLQMPCVKMVKRFSKTPLRPDFPDFKLKCLKAYIRYPYLAGGKPQSMPGIKELKAIMKDAIVVATMDPFHHGIGYGEPPDTALWPQKGGLDLARRRINEGLELFAKGDYWDYNQHCVQAKSDGRDVGQVLRYLLGPSRGTILDLAAEDTTTDYRQPAPTWVAGALMQLKPI